MKDYEVNFLKPDELTFKRTDGGILQLSTTEKKLFDVNLCRTFPHSHPYSLISIRNIEGEELGLIRNVDDLCETNQKVVIEELHLRYLIPLILKIKSIKNQKDLWFIEIQTDRGEIILLVQYPHDAIVYTKRGGLIITDIQGRRCEIRDVEKLDKKSYRELMKMI